MSQTLHFCSLLQVCFQLVKLCGLYFVLFCCCKCCIFPGRTAYRLWLIMFLLSPHRYGYICHHWTAFSFPFPTLLHWQFTNSWNEPHNSGWPPKKHIPIASFWGLSRCQKCVRPSWWWTKTSSHLAWKHHLNEVFAGVDKIHNNVVLHRNSA